MEELLGGVAAVMGGASLLVAFITILAHWKLFVKMGEPGWYSLIPFFNMFVLARHVFGNGWYMLVLLIPVAGVPWFYTKMLKGFGLDTIGALLMAVFILPIAMLIFGFNRSQWQGM